METVILDDVVLSAESAALLMSQGWKYWHDPRSEQWIFDRIIWVNEDTLDIYEWRNKRLPEVIIRIVADTIFHFREMVFSWRYESRIPEDSELGELLSEYVMYLLDDVGYLSYSEDVPKFTLADFPRVNDYLVRRCEEIYHVEPPNETEVLVAPESMWSTWGFSKGVGALYTPTHEFIVTPDKNYRSKKWRDSLLVHEYTHRLQHLRKWLIHPRDIGLNGTQIQFLGRQLALGRSVEELAVELMIPESVIKRAKGLIDHTKEYQSRYWELPTEIMAFGEQYEFLKGTGLDDDTIFNAVADHMEEKGGILLSRDEDRLFGMVTESSEKIEAAITELEEMTADENTKENSPDD